MIPVAAHRTGVPERLPAEAGEVGAVPGYDDRFDLRDVQPLHPGILQGGLGRVPDPQPSNQHTESLPGDAPQGQGRQRPVGIPVV